MSEGHMRVLVLGGYGLIGSAITKKLIRDGHAVTGLARSAQKGMTLIPYANWIGADISTLTQPESWHDHLDQIDIVVNASGALQNGLSDNIKTLQQDAIIALIKACEQTGVNRFVQISAPGADISSSTLFYKTKAAADNFLKDSTLDWTIFRPGLVIAPHAYGGTSLIRTLAAFPYIQPILMSKTPIQTVSIEDVADAVSIAINERIISVDVDLVEENPQTLLDLTLGIRAWLGFTPAKAVWLLPFWVGKSIARFADLAGWLGWRSALRTTSLTVLANGVTGDAKSWQDLSNKANKTLAQTLNDLPSTIQERIYARVMLIFPFLILTLAGFWITSGIIGFAQHTEATAKLEDVMPETLSYLFVWLGASADILIGAALLFRPLTRFACFASVFVSASYLAASVYFTPHLWADPLGPMVKVFPVMALALVIATLMEDR